MCFCFLHSLHGYSSFWNLQCLTPEYVLAGPIESRLPRRLFLRKKDLNAICQAGHSELSFVEHGKRVSGDDPVTAIEQYLE